MGRATKKYLTDKIFLFISIFLCVICVGFAFVYNSMNKTSFMIERIETRQLTVLGDIQEWGDACYNDNIILQNDINVMDCDYRIGNEEFPFSGKFDGAGHTVYLKFTQTTDNTSLFAYLAEDATVCNVNFVFDSDVIIESNSFGGIANVNAGTIKDCTVTFKSLTINNAGLFSPVATVNRGQISNVVVNGKLIGNVQKEIEEQVFFGGACVYNYGALKNSVVNVEYEGFMATDELNILKGLVKNFGISAVHCQDVGDFTFENCVAVVPTGVHTFDKVSGITVFEDDAGLYTEEQIFNKLDFSNRHWVLENSKLSLIKGDK